MPWMFLICVLLIVPGAAWAAKRPESAATVGKQVALRGWLPDAAALGVLALATLGFFWRVVAGQNWMPADGGDLVSFLYPTYRLAAATLRDGAWPLWNPYLYAGAPHVADIQAGFLYPPNLLLFLLWPNFPYAALQWLSIAHIWFAGAGMYLLLARGAGLRRLAALAGAVAFMFSESFLIHFGNLNLNAVASWTPWVFWVFLNGLGIRPRVADPSSPVTSRGTSQAQPHFAYAALAGVLLAVATLAGHIQATLFILLALACYTLAWLWLNRSRGAEEPSRRDLDEDAGEELAWTREARPAGTGKRAALATVYLGLTAAVTALLTAPVLLPALQLTGYTARATWNYQEAAGYAISPAQWIGLLIPNFFGRAPQFHWGVWPRVEVGYLGVLPLILVGLALALRRTRQTWAWATLAAVTFLLALGPYALVHGWLTLLPGFGQLRAPARLVFIVDLGLAALAAIGLDAVLGPLTRPGREGLERVWRGVLYATAGTLGIGLPLAYLGLLLIQNQDEAIILRISVTLVAVLMFAGLLLASLLWLAARRGRWAAPQTLGILATGLILLDLGSNGAYLDLGNQDPSAGFRKDAIANYLAAQPGPFRIDTRTAIQDKWQPDTAAIYGLEDIDGLVNPLLLADLTRYWEGLGSRSSPLYDLLNVGYVIAAKDVVLDWKKFELAFDGSPDLNVYRNRSSLPRAFLVPGWQVVNSHEEAWQAIHAAGFDPTAGAVVEDDSIAELSPPPAGGGPGEVTEIKSVLNGLSVKVRVDSPALLVLSQVWYPGWQVRVDGAAPGQTLRTDYLFQGVPLEPGTHQVELRFAPPLWQWGWAIAGATAVALGAWFVVAKRRLYAN